MFSKKILRTVDSRHKVGINVEEKFKKTRLYKRCLTRYEDIVRFFSRPEALLPGNWVVEELAEVIYLYEDYSNLQSMIIHESNTNDDILNTVKMDKTKCRESLHAHITALVELSQRYFTDNSYFDDCGANSDDDYRISKFKQDAVKALQLSGLLLRMSSLLKHESLINSSIDYLKDG